MIAVLRKELGTFLSSITGYLAIVIFLVLLGLFVWVFPDTAILSYPYATLKPFFNLAPFIFLFLIPAMTMRSISEEIQSGTIEILSTKPISDWNIILGKYLGLLILVAIAILPTFLYYFTVYKLGIVEGNIDGGAAIASYFGLFLIGAAFTSIGLFASSLSKAQIVAFLIGVLLCFVVYLAFDYVSRLPIFIGKFDDFIAKLGMSYHYNALSRGLIDSRDVLYFLSIIVIFLLAAKTSLSSRRW